MIRLELNKLNFSKGRNVLISNITADEIFNADELKDLLVKQIENRVRWRESVINMVNKGANEFIEIGPGKGALTSQILNEKPKSLILIEKDNHLAEELKAKFFRNKIIKIYNLNPYN